MIFKNSQSKDRSEYSMNDESKFPPIGFGGTIGTIDSKDEAYINLSRNKSASSRNSNPTYKQPSKTNKSTIKPKEIGEKYGKMMQDNLLFQENDNNQLIVNICNYNLV